MVKASVSTSLRSQTRNINNLPKFAVEVMTAALLRDAQGLAIEFENGISRNELGLQALKESTIAGKQYKGYSRPKTPLYGKGDSDNKSYKRMLQIRKVKAGWEISIRNGNHHSGLPFKAIFRIHEYGATIKGKKKNGEIYLIRIVPRPAYSRAYAKWLRKRKKVKPELQKAVNEYIANSKSITLDQIERQAMEQKKAHWYE